MFLINYLFSSSVTFRRDYFIQFNRIAILALQYSITLHIKSFLMCSGNISLHVGFHVSNITQNFQIFIFFFNERCYFNFVIHEFSPIKVLISNSYFYKFIIYNLIYFLFGIFVSCFIILGFKSFYGKEKLILIFGWIVAVLWSSLFFYIIGASDIGIKLLIIQRLLFASCGYIKNIGFTNLAFSHVNTLEVCIKFKKFIQFPLNSPNHSPMPNRQCSLEGKFINKKNSRFYSSKLRAEKQYFKFNPWWVTGFVDGEGCFHVSITERKNLKLVPPLAP